MKRISIYILLIGSFSLLQRCNNTPNSTSSYLNKYYGTQLKLPSKASWRFLDKDTIIELKNKPKLITYYNAEGCFSCRMKELQSWKILIEEIRDKSLEVDFIAIFKVDKGNEEFITNLLRNEFIYPLLCDNIGEFENENAIPENSLYHTFLVDTSNTIKIIGTPIYNPKLWNIYKKEITKMTPKNKDISRSPKITDSPFLKRIKKSHREASQYPSVR